MKSQTGLNFICSLKQAKSCFAFLCFLCAPLMQNRMFRLFLYWPANFIQPSATYHAKFKCKNNYESESLSIDSDFWPSFLMVRRRRDRRMFKLNTSPRNGLELSSETLKISNVKVLLTYTNIRPILIYVKPWKGVRKLQNNSLAEGMYLVWLSTLISRFMFCSFLYFFPFDLL